MRMTQRKGDIAVAQAVATFTRLGFDVLLPLTESAAYDLVIEKDGRLIRVQIRYAGTANGEVDLRRIHSNSKGYVIRKTKLGAYDWLYVLTGDGKEYISTSCLIDRRSVSIRSLRAISHISDL